MKTTNNRNLATEVKSLFQNPSRLVDDEYQGMNSLTAGGIATPRYDDSVSEPNHDDIYEQAITSSDETYQENTADANVAEFSKPNPFVLLETGRSYEFGINGKVENKTEAMKYYRQAIEAGKAYNPDEYTQTLPVLGDAYFRYARLLLFYFEDLEGFNKWVDDCGTDIKMRWIEDTLKGVHNLNYDFVNGSQYIDTTFSREMLNVSFDFDGHSKSTHEKNVRYAAERSIKEFNSRETVESLLADYSVENIMQALVLVRQAFQPLPEEQLQAMIGAIQSEYQDLISTCESLLHKEVKSHDLRASRLDLSQLRYEKAYMDPPIMAFINQKYLLSDFDLVTMDLDHMLDDTYGDFAYAALEEARERMLPMVKELERVRLAQAT